MLWAQSSLCMAFQERELQEISFKGYEQNRISSKSYPRMSLLLFLYQNDIVEEGNETIVKEDYLH